MMKSVISKGDSNSADTSLILDIIDDVEAAAERE